MRKQRGKATESLSYKTPRGDHRKHVGTLYQVRRSSSNCANQGHTTLLCRCTMKTSERAIPNSKDILQSPNLFTDSCPYSNSTLAKGPSTKCHQCWILLCELKSRGLFEATSANIFTARCEGRELAWWLYKWSLSAVQSNNMRDTMHLSSSITAHSRSMERF